MATLEDLLPFIKRQRGTAAPAPAGEAPVGDESKVWKARSAAYHKVIDRYADYIDEHERKTLPELKALVNGNDAAVLDAKRRIEEKLTAENKSKPEDTALACLELVASLAPLHSELGVSFWFTPAELFELGAADPFDRTLLLCSLLRSFELEARVLVLELSDGSKHPVVEWLNAGRSTVLDPSQQHELLQFSGERADALKVFSFGGKTVRHAVFEFNDREFEEHEEAAGSTPPEEGQFA